MAGSVGSYRNGIILFSRNFSKQVVFFRTTKVKKIGHYLIKKIGPYPKLLPLSWLNPQQMSLFKDFGMVCIKSERTRKVGPSLIAFQILSPGICTFLPLLINDEKYSHLSKPGFSRCANYQNTFRNISLFTSSILLNFYHNRH